MTPFIETFKIIISEYSTIIVGALICLITIIYLFAKTNNKDEEEDSKYDSFIVNNDKKLSRNNLFSNCLINNGDLSQDYYRFSFDDIEDVRLYIACIYDENNNKADVNTTIQNYKDIIEFLQTRSVFIEEKKYVKNFDQYTFNLKNSLKYIKEYTKELYETDLVLGLNNIIHGYSEDGYIDFYIIAGDETFDSDFYEMIDNAIKKNFSDRRSEVMEEIMLEELECETGVDEEDGGDYSYENEVKNSAEYIDGTVSDQFLDELKETASDVQELVNKVNEIAGTDIQIGNGGSLEIEEEAVEDPCDILRYITYTNDEGEEEDIQVKALPKKFNDWEERFANQLTGSEIDAVNELYAKWYAKKNKGKTVTLPDGRQATINTSESDKKGGTGNALADAITSIAGATGDSKTDALIGAISALAASNNMVNQAPPEEPKGPEFDMNKLEETMNNNSK